MEVATQQSANLSDENVARRLRAGIVFLMMALVVATVLQLTRAPAMTRLVLFPLFFLADNAFFQAIHKTCGISAFRGLRHTAEGNEPIADPRALAAARSRGVRQLLHSLAGAVLLTGVFVWANT